MISNEERRYVAARLRNYENLRESFRESPICAFLDALGVGYIDWKGVCNRLAELIEPEPERTCRKVPGRMKYGRRMPACSECGYSLGDDRWYFCQKCGAKVVE